MKIGLDGSVFDSTMISMAGRGTLPDGYSFFIPMPVGTMENAVHRVVIKRKDTGHEGMLEPW